ncbi:MAG: NADH-quinone oxidoreductase subunit C, partial [Candidatus Omnitrophica bacterium]|nr:NADH-quinone oxidoreductase subunit C [Candidatus Omnitrophota bacterium]
ALGLEGSHLLVQPQDLIRVCQWLKSSEYQLDYAANLTAVDYPPTPASSASQNEAAGAGRIDVVYHLYSMAKKHGPVTIRVTLPRATPVVPSLVSIYRGAEFQEREVYDLYGVTFEHHPDLRRILMWEGFQGHPMRKDYVPENQDVLEESR